MPKGIYKRIIPISDKTKKKISEVHIRSGHKPPQTQSLVRGMLGKHHLEETKRKISETCKKLGIKPLQMLSEKHWHWKGGLPKCKECNNQLSNYNTIYCRKCCFKGERSYRWKGGISPINNQIRGSLEYKLWSDSVWNRDNNCCQKCGENRISKLVAHHILNFSKYIELRFAIDNGITFCRDCHKKFHNQYGRKNNTKEQLTEFLQNG